MAAVRWTLAWMLSLALAAACSSESDDASGGEGTPPMCNQDPWSCPAGQTCWPTNVDGSDFACLNSGPGAMGDPCLGAVGAPECGVGMMCFLISGYPRVCAPFCDPTSPERGCPDQAACLTGLTSGGAEIKMCVPEQAQPADGGSEPHADDAGTEQDGGR